MLNISSNPSKSPSIPLFKGGSSYSSLLKREVGRDFIRVFSFGSGKYQVSGSAGGEVTK
jgi:hypothetical protein